MKRRLFLICMLAFLCGFGNSWGVPERNHITFWSNVVITGYTLPMVPTSTFNVYAIPADADTSTAKMWATHSALGTYYWIDATPQLYDIYVKRTVGGVYVREARGVRLGLRGIMLLAADPSPPNAGDVWINTTTGELKFATAATSDSVKVVCTN
jgi:hypothetical protein